MKVKDILKNKGPEVITIWEEKTLYDAICTLVENKIGALLVLNQDGKIVGIISERDILRACYEDCDNIRTAKVKDKMTKKVIITEPDDDLAYVEKIMTENRIRHLPVITNKRLVGIISIGDIVKSMRRQSAVENRYLKEYIEGKYPA